jgi:XRE family transcriptional regulator, regulator of sulfur utilization
MNIGETIKVLRTKKKLRQKDLAARCGLSQNYLSQIENGHRKPTLDSLESISSVLDIPFPILSFLTLEDSDISKEKKNEFQKVNPVIKKLIEEVFFK